MPYRFIFDFVSVQKRQWISRGPALIALSQEVICTVSSGQLKIYTVYSDAHGNRFSVTIVNNTCTLNSETYCQFEVMGSAVYKHVKVT